METTAKNTQKIEGHKVTDLKSATEKALKLISQMDSHKYKASGDVTKPSPKADKAFADMGICDRRRLRRILNELEGHLTLAKANKLLRLLERTGVHETKIRIDEPKHTAIQLKRCKMVAAKKAYEAALAEYKAEKGDYYKNK